MAVYNANNLDVEAQKKDGTALSFPSFTGIAKRLTTRKARTVHVREGRELLSLVSL